MAKLVTVHRGFLVKNRSRIVGERARNNLSFGECEKFNAKVCQLYCGKLPYQMASRNTAPAPNSYRIVGKMRLCVGACRPTCKLHLGSVSDRRTLPSFTSTAAPMPGMTKYITGLTGAIVDITGR